MKKTDGKFDLDAMQSSLKSYDWGSLKKYASPQAAEDLNIFLEKLPQNTGQTMLIIAAVVWCGAGLISLFTTVQLQKITKLRAEFTQAEALQPIVPKIENKAVDSKQVESFLAKSGDIYKGLKMQGRGSTVTITASTTNAYGQFREAIGHVQNGGNGWRVSIDRLCVGRECDRNPLSAILKINTVSVSRAG